MLIQQHRAMVKQYNGEFSQLKNALYGTLASTEGKVNTDSLVVLMGMKQQEIEKLHYSHFQDIHALCTPEQAEKFQQLTGEIANIFAPPHADKAKKCCVKYSLLRLRSHSHFLAPPPRQQHSGPFALNRLSGEKKLFPIVAISFRTPTKPSASIH